MKTLEGKLFLEFQELLDAGVSSNTIKGAKKFNRASWLIINDPSDRRRVLIGYEELKQQYKDLVIAKYGNPYLYASTSIIKKYLISAPADVDLINSYRCSDGNFLPYKHQELYIKACQYLNLLSSATCRWIKSVGFDSMATFTEAVVQQVTVAELPLPANYSRLKAKIKEYRKKGAECVISKKFGNQNSRKLGDTELAVVGQCYAKANQFGAERIAFEYNLIAVQYGWKTVTAEAILWNINQPKFKQQYLPNRKGIAAFRELADFSISRQRPSRPNMLWVGDGTPFELYYRIDNKSWNRKVVYCVIDAYNDYVVGYSIGDTESNALAKLAWRNACVNHSVLPDQVKSDRFGLKEMRAFYSEITKTPDYFTPSKAGNARDKVVEQFFAKLRNAVVRDFPNHAGGNITSNEQPNRDFLNKISPEFPDEAGVIVQIHECIERWNTMQRPKLDNMSLEQQWKSGDWSQSRKLDDMMRLSSFGVKSEYTNKLTNKGITITLNGVPHTYMLLTDEFADTIGTEYSITYDPLDLSSILAVGRDGKLRFVVPAFGKMPMAFGDMKEGDRTRLNSILEFKKNRIELIISRNAAEMDLVTAEGLNKMFPLLNGGNKGLMNESANVLKQMSNDRFDDEANLVPVVKPQRDQWDD